MFSISNFENIMTDINWNNDDLNELLISMVGFEYGSNPIDFIDAIKIAKQSRAIYFNQLLNFEIDDKVLDLGSGLGFTSDHIATMVKQVWCCDISKSYLDNISKLNSSENLIKFLIHNFTLPNDKFNKIISDACFIHLNIYQIDQYFKQFKKCLAIRGRILIQLLSDSYVDIGLFDTMSKYYEENNNNYHKLLQWVPSAIIHVIAKKNGFVVENIISENNQTQLWIFKHKEID